MPVRQLPHCGNGFLFRGIATRNNFESAIGNQIREDRYHLLEDSWELEVLRFEQSPFGGGWAYA